MVRAAVVTEVGGKVVVRDDVQVIDPGPGQVKVSVKATGVCHSDLSAQDGTLPVAMPCVLGHEGAGEVVAIGPGVTQVKEGDHVVVAWSAPCGRCKTCLRGQPNLCMELTMASFGTPGFVVDGTPYFGLAGTGTFSQEVVLPQQGVVAIPHDVPYEIGALIGCGVMTGAGAAINTAQVKPGSTVAVIGCGGVGISVIQGARICGAAQIVGIDMIDKKLDWATQFGATHSVTPEFLDEVKQEVTGGEGFDYVFEVVGRSSTIRQAYDLTRRGGTTVVVGAGKMDDMVTFGAFELFWSEKTIIGSWYGSADVRRDFDRLLALWRNGRLDLEGMITSRIELDDVNEAFEAVKSGEVIRQIITL